MDIVAHRGFHRSVSENSLNAFQQAITIGCDRIELDVRLTRDRCLVVIHDDDIERLTGEHGHIHTMTLDQVRRLDIGHHERVPTMEQVIDLCKGKVQLQIELKAPGTPEALCNLLSEKGIYNSLVTSFQPALLREMRTHNEETHLGFLFATVPGDLWETVTKLHLSYICPRYDIATQDLIAEVHMKGVNVYIYHVNDLALARTFQAWGADSIGTDTPAEFMKELSGAP